MKIMIYKYDYEYDYNCQLSATTTTTAGVFSFSVSIVISWKSCKLNLNERWLQINKRRMQKAIGGQHLTNWLTTHSTWLDWKRQIEELQNPKKTDRERRE